MKYWKVNLVMLWFSQLLIMAGFEAMIPFIPLFMKDGLCVSDPAKLALYVSMFNFSGAMGYAVCCPIWGNLADRFGVKPMLLRGTFVTAFMFPLMGYVRSPWMLILLRLISSGCAGTTAASQTMVARTAPDEYQGFAQGVLSTAIWGGAMLGNVIGGFIIHYYNYQYAFWFCGIMYFLAGISILFTRDSVKRKAPAPMSKTVSHRRFNPLPSFSRAIWITLALFLLMGLIRNLEKPYISLRVEEMTSHEMAAYWTGIISAIVCVGAIISGALAGYMADHIPPKKLVVPILAISAITLFLQGIGNNLVLFAIARVMLYTVAGGLQPVLQKILSGVTPQEQRGASFGYASSLGQIGVMASSLMGGLIVAHFGVSGIFIAAALLFIIFIPIMLKGIDASLKYVTLKIK